MANTEKSIIFFDGVCNLCNGAVQKVLKNDTKAKFSFASIQSAFTAEFFEVNGFQNNADTIILFYKGKFYTKSTAALMVAFHLKFPYPLFTFFRIFPSFLRDPIYDFIARNRYKWFGKQESCMIPERQWKARFLD